MVILVEEDSGVVVLRLISGLLQHGHLLLLLLVELHCLGVVLEQFRMLLQQQLLICELLRLLDIGWLQDGIAFVSTSTFIGEVPLITILIRVLHCYNLSVIIDLFDRYLTLHHLRGLLLFTFECLNYDT